MIEPTQDTNGTTAPRDAAYWAQPVERLTVAGLPEGAVNLNVAGRQLAGPLQGFGQLWQKTYRIVLQGTSATPAEVVKAWKDGFPSFWPAGNRFYGSGQGIAPGEVAVLNLAGPGGLTAPGGAPIISTGILVIYADDESFSFMTPQGHMFAAFITFSAFVENEETVAQAQMLIRASDPIYEFMLRVGAGHKMEDDFWIGTLSNLAASFGVQGQPVSRQVNLVDPKMQFQYARNIWHNAAVRTGLYLAAAPLRWVRHLFAGSPA